MSFHFQAMPYSALDPISETTIPRPRISPAVLRSGLQGTKCQFAIYRGKSHIGGVGFEGWDEVTQDNSQAETLRAMLACKQAPGSADDDLTYLHGVAQEFVRSFAGRTDNDISLSYVAVTSPQALEQLQISIPATTTVRPDGRLALASVDVPA